VPLLGEPFAVLQVTTRGRKADVTQGGDLQAGALQGERMNEQARAGLEAIRREHPEWNIAFIGGRRARWMAACVFEAPAGYVYVECFSLQALRARMIANDWTVTPKYPLSAEDQPRAAKQQ
jgi:hypothetical protein